MSVPADPPPGPSAADPPPGLAAERTALAWTRTALAYAVCVLLCSRLGAGSPPTVLVVLLLGGLATSTLAMVAAARGKRARADVASGRPIAAPLATATVAGLTALLGLAAALLVLW